MHAWRGPEPALHSTARGRKEKGSGEGGKGGGCLLASQHTSSTQHGFAQPTQRNATQRTGFRAAYNAGGGPKHGSAHLEQTRDGLNIHWLLGSGVYTCVPCCSGHRELLGFLQQPYRAAIDYGGKETTSLCIIETTGLYEVPCGSHT